MSGSLSITSPTGAEVIEVANTGALVATVALTQARDAAGYQKNPSTTGGTLSFKAGQSVMQIGNSGTISTLTINLHVSPVDGQRALIFCNQAVSTLTLQLAPTSSGQTLNDAVTSLTQDLAVEYLYSAANKSWDRVQ